MLVYKEISRSLVQMVSEFAPTLEEHIKDYEEVLSHILFEDLHRFLADALKRSKNEFEKEKAIEVATRAMEFIELCTIQGDDLVKELVCVSFIESLDIQSDEYATLRILMKENTNTIFKLIFNSSDE